MLSFLRVVAFYVGFAALLTWGLFALGWADAIELPGFEGNRAPPVTRPAPVTVAVATPPPAPEPVPKLSPPRETRTPEPERKAAALPDPPPALKLPAPTPPPPPAVVTPRIEPPVVAPPVSREAVAPAPAPVREAQRPAVVDPPPPPPPPAAAAPPREPVKLAPPPAPEVRPPPPVVPPPVVAPPPPPARSADASSVTPPPPPAARAPAASPAAQPARRWEPTRRIAGFDADALLDQLEHTQRARDDIPCVMFRDLTFKAGTTTFGPRALAQIGLIAEALNAVPGHRIEIGSKLGPGRLMASDARLRAGRATRVHDRLVALGIAPGRLMIDRAEAYESVAADVSRAAGSRAQSMGLCVHPA